LIFKNKRKEKKVFLFLNFDFIFKFFKFLFFNFYYKDLIMVNEEELFVPISEVPVFELDNYAYQQWLQSQKRL
tara:strand:- start:580 stop:798 length:219 start_codon:yes stop_codon:yes gene_type:complete